MLKREEKESTVHFIRRQIGEIRNGGPLVLIQKSTPGALKIRDALLVILTLPLVLPIVIVIRLLNPIIAVRFGPLESSRIGNLAGNTETYLSERDMGIHCGRAVDIFYYSGPISNRQLKKMWDRTKGLHIYSFAYHIDMLNRLIPGGKKNMIPWRDANQDRDIYGAFERMPPHISFTPEEEDAGRMAAGRCGIPDGVPFICFHARESAYLNTLFKYRNFRYHNYRDSNIDNFVPAMKEMGRRGYYAVRTGVMAERPLPVDDLFIIDYAAKYRTDFLDIYLGSKCYFYLGDLCGYSSIPMIFRRPLAITNMVPLKYVPSWSDNIVFILKKLWHRKGRHFLTFREILDSEIGSFCHTEKYEKAGIELVENTPDEIIDLAVEMDERIKGAWQTTDEDKELQRRFWTLFKQDEIHKSFLSHVGTKFLRENKELLG